MTYKSLSFWKKCRIFYKKFITRLDILSIGIDLFGVSKRCNIWMKDRQELRKAYRLLEKTC